jgi:hypothetical protein
MMRPPRPIMKISSVGIFVLAGPVLMKYNATTLKPEGRVNLMMRGTTPAQRGRLRMLQPPLPAAMALAGGTGGCIVVVVIGDRFFSVDAVSMRIIAKALIPGVRPGQRPGFRGGQSGRQNGESGMGPGAPNGGGGMRAPRRGGRQRMAFGPMGTQPPVPVLEIAGNTAYLLHANQIIAIDITTGKVLAHGNLALRWRPAAANR